VFRSICSFHFLFVSISLMRLGWAKGYEQIVVIKDMTIQNQKSIEEWKKEITLMRYEMLFRVLFVFCLLDFIAFMSACPSIFLMFLVPSSPRTLSRSMATRVIRIC
jgi:hypothetical protein